MSISAATSPAQGSDKSKNSCIFLLYIFYSFFFYPLWFSSVVATQNQEFIILCGVNQKPKRFAWLVGFWESENQTEFSRLLWWSDISECTPELTQGEIFYIWLGCKILKPKTFWKCISRTGQHFHQPKCFQQRNIFFPPIKKNHPTHTFRCSALLRVAFDIIMGLFGIGTKRNGTQDLVAFDTAACSYSYIIGFRLWDCFDF